MVNHRRFPIEDHRKQIALVNVLQNQRTQPDQCASRLTNVWVSKIILCDPRTLKHIFKHMFKRIFKRAHQQHSATADYEWIKDRAPIVCVESHGFPRVPARPGNCPAWMMLRYARFFKTFLRHIGINLRVDISACPQQHLHHAQICDD